MTIWLTGCSSGLGAALTDAFIEKGHKIAAGARRKDRIATLQEAYGPDEGHYFQSFDVSSDQQVADFCAAAYEETGAPDILINNAAIINPPAKLWEISAEDFDRLTAINLNGVANMIRHVVPLMIQAGKGVIVNISSGWGRSTSPEVAPYCASKWGIEGLTRALADELPAGLGAVALNPGIIDTDMLQSSFGPAASQYPSANEWVRTAAPFILGLTADDNGQALTAP